jgi:hypothetical protein
METDRIEAFLDKLSAKADVLGGIIGFYGSTKGWSDIKSVISNLMQKPHFPYLEYVVKGITTPGYGEGNVFYAGLAAAILGYVVKELEFPVIGRYGDALSRAGMGAIGGALLWSILVHSGGVPESPPTGSSSSSSSSSYSEYNPYMMR